ncbi:amidase family protein [Variovorax sp. dw_308]|uniref:amidase family protein n=1 Tax=Variovorax sp. dw_308 TaxID=2721546 RepID=UPI001C46574D|nr:amidase family protein [Variovorax sp. dw_308]
MNLDYATATATQLVDALATRQVGALELCDAAIARIEALDGEINAVVVRDFERAREQARAADVALGKGARGALLGVPMTVKESFNVAGLPTTWGLEFAKQIPVKQDAVAVSRLKAAGAVILGKTNVALALGEWQSVNPVYGRTLNPLDTSRSPGGSSGGAAAAVASGMVPLEVGSDIGGSIRVPAHFCGVYGHKPSVGLLPGRGHDFPGAASAVADVIAVIGPLARSADDIERALDVLAGPDVDDAAAWCLELPPARHAQPSGLRVLVMTTHPCASVSAEVQAAVEATAQRLARAGAQVSHGSDLLPDLEAMHKMYAAMLKAVVTRGAPDAPPSISAHEWFTMLDRRAQLRVTWRKLFESFDVVLCPPFGTAAFPHIPGPIDWNTTMLSIDGASTRYHEQLAWAGAATTAGLPATVAPVGKSAEGMPIGVQIIGPLLEDRTTVAVARWLQ